MADFALSFRQLTDPNDPLWDFVTLVLDQCFPPDERRQHSVQRRIAASEPRFFQCVVFDKDQPVGIISYWRLETANYLEHIATHTASRGGGLGGAIIKDLLTQVNGSWIGEVEHPNDDISRRRIGFYQRLGFELIDIDNYQQPSYGKGKKPIPMLLMCSGELKNRQTYQPIIDQIHRVVYHCV